MRPPTPSSRRRPSFGCRCSLCRARSSVISWSSVVCGVCIGPRNTRVHGAAPLQYNNGPTMLTRGHDMDPAVAQAGGPSRAYLRGRRLRVVQTIALLLAVAYLAYFAAVLASGQERVALASLGITDPWIVAYF